MYMKGFNWVRVSGGLLFAVLWTPLSAWGFYVAVDRLSLPASSLAYFLLLIVWLLGSVWVPALAALAVPVFRKRLKVRHFDRRGNP